MLMHKLLTAVASVLTRMGCRRAIYRPDSQGKPQLYLERFYIWKSPNREIMLHRFHMGDRGDVHNHPWDSGGMILATGYWEYQPTGYMPNGLPFPANVKLWRGPGYMGSRKASDYHKVELNPGTEGKVWTLFWTGKRKQSWGFFEKTEGYIPFQEQFRRDGPDKLGEDHGSFVGRLFPRKR